MRRAPDLSPEARKAALAKAALVRKQRAEIRSQLANGEIVFSDLLERLDDDTVGKMKVLVVLESLPGIGKVKARKILRSKGVHENRRMRGLGPQQRARLIQLLG